MAQKRVAAIHDISCFGKCSLTVALPIISAAGIECSVIPTAVLSTHTGGFTGFTYRDLTEDIMPIAQHWQSLELGFDALYTGFLGSFEQLELVGKLFDMFKTGGNLILVDPVMADNGKLYEIFTPEFAKGMAKLCGKADVIVPNLTEAAFMLGEPYREGPYTKDYIEDLMKRLCGMGPGRVVLTGVWFKGDKLGAATYEKATGEVTYAFAQRVEGYYHGTGDVFGSALLSAMLCGKTLGEAAQIAVDFTVDSIIRTYDAKTDIRFGVNFEQSLPGMLKSIGIIG